MDSPGIAHHASRSNGSPIGLHPRIEIGCRSQDCCPQALKKALAHSDFGNLLINLSAVFAHPPAIFQQHILLMKQADILSGLGIQNHLRHHKGVQPFPVRTFSPEPVLPLTGPAGRPLHPEEPRREHRHSGNTCHTSAPGGRPGQSSNSYNGKNKLQACGEKKLHLPDKNLKSASPVLAVFRLSCPELLHLLVLHQLIIHPHGLFHHRLFHPEAHTPPESIFVLCRHMPHRRHKERHPGSKKRPENHLLKGPFLIKGIQEPGGHVNADKWVETVHNQGNPINRPFPAVGKKEPDCPEMTAHILLKFRLFSFYPSHTALPSSL